MTDNKKTGTNSSQQEGGVLGSVVGGVNSVLTGEDGQGGLLGGLSSATGKTTEGVGKSLNKTTEGVGDTAGSATEGVGNVGKGATDTLEGTVRGLAGGEKKK
ncbi:uncharacterized protein GGS25DRAFT_521139 [Hypoxylon fragiforme]|uniref:uncharacterized protein n=1 Tax=Hypoxylon fragiforme TaxID=63214 RepID=UPI0020C5E5D1|nr:uncharacterized protein GGS25DRAFT_521139 [Hypoxylon fragiforme]KAI2610337.1 hypothetical protein GGS25DRAFT_521139 [Hypoxylon fragiforme]